MNKCKVCGAEAGTGFVVCASCASKKMPATNKITSAQSVTPPRSEITTPERIMFGVSLLCIGIGFFVSDTYNALDIFFLRLLGATVLLGIWPALIARHKGRRGAGLFILWMMYGGMLFIVAIIHALIMKSQDPEVEAMNSQLSALNRCDVCGTTFKDFYGLELVEGKGHLCANCRSTVKPAN
jgi:hypothetical protein